MAIRDEKMLQETIGQELMADWLADVFKIDQRALRRASLAAGRADRSPPPFSLPVGDGCRAHASTARAGRSAVTTGSCLS